MKKQFRVLICHLDEAGNERIKGIVGAYNTIYKANQQAKAYNDPTAAAPTTSGEDYIRVQEVYVRDEKKQ